MRIPLFLLSAVFAGHLASGADWNAAVLEAVRSMPSGGGYSVSSEASARFRSSAEAAGDRVKVDAARARPSYCSSATYLVFLKVIAEGQRRGLIRLDPADASAIAPQAVPDGRGIWGRWNANGPGTARMFHELGLGRNFTDFGQARAGDFMKIFWTDAVGRRERGHLVVYLGREMRDGEEHICFWSSNQPDGYGEKAVPRAKIARAIFSRLEAPERIRGAAGIQREDAYLATLLERESTFAEACRLSGIK